MKVSKHPFNILLIEDEKILRENYVAYLKIFFNEVYEAKDGEEAYEVYREKKPHILIVDIDLPKLNGLDLLKKIREEDHTTKAIVLTAHSDQSFLLKAASLKLTEYLVKPVSRKKLQDALYKVLNELSNFKTIPIKRVTLEDGYSWDYELNELYENSEAVSLTNKEKTVFTLLISNLNHTFSHDDIIYEVWNDLNEGGLDTLKTVIKNLRRKLPKDTIKNVFGVGYKIEL